MGLEIATPKSRAGECDAFKYGQPKVILTQHAFKIKERFSLFLKTYLGFYSVNVCACFWNIYETLLLMCRNL